VVSLLECEGHAVRAASDGEQALRLAAAMRPDVVLLDLGMPHLDGFGVAQQIRSASWGSTIALIALTGFGQQEDRQRTRRAGFDAHLVKPSTLEQIREAIREATATRAQKPETVES
jgi:CheY-like chemotaxis protein